MRGRREGAEGGRRWREREDGDGRGRRCEHLGGINYGNKADKKILTTPSSIVITKVIHVFVPN